MAILGKTSITELNLITPLSNANLENSKITINGTAVPLGGSYNLIDSTTTSSLLYTLSQGDSNPSDDTWYITSVSSGTGTTFYKRSHSYLYGYLKGKFDSVYQPKGSYLTTTGTAADSNKLGGVAASSYATQTWVNNKNYITSAATVANSNKLGGTAASSYALKTDLSGYLTTGGTAADSNKLGGVAASGYLTTGGTAANASKLGNVAANGYSLTGHTHGAFTGATSSKAGNAGFVPAPTTSDTDKFLKADGTWATTPNTLSTAGSSNSTNKLFLIGAAIQTANSLAGTVTNSNSQVYMQNGTLYADNIYVNTITMASEANGFQISDGATLEDRLAMAGWKAGSANSTNKLYLVGAGSQSGSGAQTYSNSAVYMQAGKLYANGSEVGTMETINNTVSALTASNVSLDARVSAIENGGVGGGVSVALGSGTTYLVGTPSSNPNQTLSEAIFDTSVYIQSGNCYATAFYQTSDETLKDFYEEIGVDFDELKNIPKKYFSWKDRRKDGIDIGTSAQALQKVYPELVSEGEDGLTVDYARLSVVALKAIDQLHEENEMLKEMLAKMDERLSKLENEK